MKEKRNIKQNPKKYGVEAVAAESTRGSEKSNNESEVDQAITKINTTWIAAHQAAWFLTEKCWTSKNYKSHTK